MNFNRLYPIDFVFAAAGTVSAIVRVGPDVSIVGFRTDADWVTGDLTFETSMEDENTASPTNFLSCVDGLSAPLKFTAIVASKAYCISQDIPLIPGVFYRLTSSATQTAGTTLKAILRKT